MEQGDWVMSETIPETDLPPIDPISYLAELNGTPTFTQAAEHLVVLKPALCDLYLSASFQKCL
jgi:hypothetical protein